MEEAAENEGKKRFRTQVHGFTMDLVRKLMGKNNCPGNFEGGGVEDEGEIELSLGLSLNGKFGVDQKRSNVKLMRAASASDCILNGEENQARGVPVGVHAPPLNRTCSLPSVTEEWRKRKELQPLKSTEEKRRRMGKLRLPKVGREMIDLEENCCEDNGCIGHRSGQVFVTSNANGAMPLPQGSELGSQGNGSPSFSQLERPPIQGNQNNDAKSPATIHYQQPENEHKLAIKSGPSIDLYSRRPHAERKPPIAPRTTVVQMPRAPIVDKPSSAVTDLKNYMPCVSTIGEGPNGKRIEGFLYRYEKEEEVKIVCVCHGSFLSPAEFVSHAGGGDVEHPLRHIIVNPSSWV